jgi:hypothetical protein
MTLLEHDGRPYVELPGGLRVYLRLDADRGEFVGLAVHGPDGRHLGDAAVLYDGKELRFVASNGAERRSVGRNLDLGGPPEATHG